LCRRLNISPTIGYKWFERSEVIPSLMKRLLDFCSSNPEHESFRGNLVVVELHRIRIRE